MHDYQKLNKRLETEKEKVNWNVSKETVPNAVLRGKKRVKIQKWLKKNRKKE